MTELERDLEALGTQLDYPREDLRIPVRAGIMNGRRRRRRFEQVVVAFALLAAAFGPAFIAGGSRHAILDFLDGGNGTSANEAVREQTPTAALPLGTPSTRSGAGARPSFRVLLPRGVRPDGLYLGSGITTGAVTVIFHAQGLRLRLTEFRGRQVSATQGERVSVAGTGGIWQAPVGRFSFTDATGTRRAVPPTAAGNSLVWQRGALTLQLQAVGLTRPTAVALARTVV